MPKPGRHRALLALALFVGGLGPLGSAGDAGAHTSRSGRVERRRAAPDPDAAGGHAVTARPPAAPRVRLSMASQRELMSYLLKMLRTETARARLALQRSRTPLVLHVASRALGSYEPLASQLERLGGGIVLDPERPERASPGILPAGGGARRPVIAALLIAEATYRRKLEGLRGVAFDAGYLAPMAQRHHEMAALLAQLQACHLHDRELRRWIAEASAQVRQQLELVEKILSRMMLPPLSGLG